MTTIIAAYGCTIYQKPRSISDVPFRQRSHSKIDAEVKVTVAVLSAEESRQLFGVNLAGQGIQPVWVRVQNDDSVPYWLMSAGLDPDYFSPLEAAYAFHSVPDTDTRLSVRCIYMAASRILPDRSPVTRSMSATIYGRGSVPCATGANRSGSVKSAGISVCALPLKPGRQ
jgi:hypothetical protein